MKKIVYILIAIVALYFGVKSCVITTIHINDYYLFENSDGVQRNRLALIPGNEMVITKRLGEIDEIGIYKIIGENATHYFSGLYSTGTIPFGLRYYRNAELVLNAECELIKKTGNSFPKEGEKFRMKIIIFKDRAKIGNISWKRLPITEEEKENLKLGFDILKKSL